MTLGLVRSGLVPGVVKTEGDPQMKKRKIIIIVEGGCVRDVYANDSAIDVELLDYDNDDEVQDRANKDRGQVVAEMLACGILKQIF